MKVIRYPNSNDQSLRAYSAADEYLLKCLEDLDINNKVIITYNDRFGYLNCHLNKAKPISVISYKSQEKSHRINLKANGFEINEESFINPLSIIEQKADLVLMKVPKSLDLFDLYLSQIATCISNEGIVYCSFMTRHFTKQLLSIASEYFEEVEQGLAWKKARVLTLKKKKNPVKKEMINVLKLNEKESLKQYFGVFSANEIDYATQFFLENIQLKSDYKNILDLASGNGVLAYVIRKRLPESEVHLVDDFYLAVESSKLNIDLEDKFFHYNDCLDEFPENTFDLVVANPPFHFEYETNIEVSLELFKQVHFCLKVSGSFQLVANRHLNYGTHLKKLYTSVEIIAQNEKFEIYNCCK